MSGCRGSEIHEIQRENAHTRRRPLDKAAADGCLRLATAPVRAFHYMEIFMPDLNRYPDGISNNAADCAP